uniref:Uncharacterized protein n=1 Tax=Schistocephalus solidus TaxID=70667 RepID=A0A0X3NTY1_SCHSO
MTCSGASATGRHRFSVSNTLTFVIQAVPPRQLSLRQHRGANVPPRCAPAHPMSEFCSAHALPGAGASVSNASHLGLNVHPPPLSPPWKSQPSWWTPFMRCPTFAVDIMLYETAFNGVTVCSRHTDSLFCR